MPDRGIESVLDDPQFTAGPHPAPDGSQRQMGGPFESLRGQMIPLAFLACRPHLKENALHGLIPLVLGAAPTRGPLAGGGLEQQGSPRAALDEFREFGI